MIYLQYISIVLTIFYVLLIFIYWCGWITIKKYVPKSTLAFRSFSILIPVRNEAAVIEKCLEDICKQHFPSQHFEVIIIDDHSTDETIKVINQFISANTKINIKLLSMIDDAEQRKLKKAAITYGVSHAQNDFIVLTDADCERGVEWLTTINHFLIETGIKMCYAPVAFSATNVFEKIQSMEFAGLVGIGAAAINIKNPNMCSAANLIFEKNVFYEVEGYKGYDGIASGDDEFLMHKVFKRYPNRVRFLKNKKAIVYTSANTSIKQLADQRRRWVSKSTKYENRYITAILVGAYLFNLAIIVNLFTDYHFGLNMLYAKIIIETIFLFSVLHFFDRKKYLLFLPFAEIFHIMYVLIIGIWANYGTYSWKGRDVK